MTDTSGEIGDGGTTNGMLIPIANIADPSKAITVKVKGDSIDYDILQYGNIPLSGKDEYTLSAVDGKLLNGEETLKIQAGKPIAVIIHNKGKVFLLDLKTLWLYSPPVM